MTENTIAANGSLFQPPALRKASGCLRTVPQRKQDYSGKWEPTTLTGYFILSHDITKTKALTCADCHSAKDYIGLNKLGYGPDRIKQLTSQNKRYQ